MLKRKVVIFGGGTIEPIRNHLSLCSPAFGSTAKKLHQAISNSHLYLTKMADSSSELVTSLDVKNKVEEILEDSEVGTIIMNTAFCDFKPSMIGVTPNGFHSERLRTADGPVDLTLFPFDKIIPMIRKYRPDIFLVAFKTTTGKTSEEQFKIALKMMKSAKCNLVLANDVVTRNNMIITAEESIYGESTDREQALKELVEMIKMRADLTYDRSNFVEDFSEAAERLPSSLKKVLNFLIDNGGFIENNGNGFTPGHFCFRTGKNTFLSSQRKADHNKVFKEGMSKIFVNDKQNFTVIGRRKASVGARSQWLMLRAYEDEGYDCIVHTHNSLKEGASLHSVPQKPFQCGSEECGMNTCNNLKDYGELKAVYLEKHGPNILFKSSTDPQIVIDFLKENIKLGEKVK